MIISKYPFLNVILLPALILLFVSGTYEKLDQSGLKELSEGQNYNPDNYNQVNMPSHEGITFSQVEVNLWRDRAVNGPYKSDNDAFANSPGIWDGIVIKANLLTTAQNTANDYFNGNFSNESAFQRLGFRTMMAAFVYLIKGDATKGALVKSKLLAQVNAPNIHWTGLPDAPTETIMFSAAWIIRLFHAYDYTYDLYTVQERATIDAWFLAAAIYFQNGLNYSLTNYLFPNRAIGDYETKNYGYTHSSQPPELNTSYAWIDSGGNRHNLYPHVGYWYNNKRGVLASCVGLLGVYFNNQTMIDDSKLYFKEWMKFGVFPDGTQVEYNRNTSSAPQQGSIGYASINIEACLLVAKWLMDNKSDTELYTYSTTDGFKGTEIGGVNGNGRGSKSLFNILLTFSEHMDGSVLRYTGSVADANLQDAYSENANRYYQQDVILSLANIYYHSQRFQDIYMRTAPGTIPYSGGRYGEGPNGWTWGNGLSLVGYQFQYAGTENISSNQRTAADENLSSREGITFGQIDVDVWRDRALNGPYKSDNDAFVNSPGIWDGIVNKANLLTTAQNTANDYFNGDFSDGPTFQKLGFRTMMAAFVYLVKGDAAKGALVKAKLLAQVNAPNIQWTDLPDLPTEPMMFSAAWVIRLFHAYDYTYDLYTAEEKASIDAWFLAAATSFQTGLNYSLSKYLFPNRTMGDYNTKNYGYTESTQPPGSNINYAWIDSMGNRHNLYPHIGYWYNYRRGTLATCMGLLGIYFNDQTMIDDSKLYFKEWIKFGVFPDGTQVEYNRNTSSAPQQGSVYFASINIEECLLVAKWLSDNRSDTELYDYSTVDGYNGTEIGGINGNGRGSKSLFNILLTFSEHMDGKVLRYRSSVADANLQDAYSQITNRYYQNDLILCLANLHFKYQRFQDIYMRAAPGTIPYSGGQYAAGQNGWTWGNGLSLVGYQFQYAGREEITNLYE